MVGGILTSPNNTVMELAQPNWDGEARMLNCRDHQSAQLSTTAMSAWVLTKMVAFLVTDCSL